VSEELPAEEFTFVGDITDYWTYTHVRDRLLFMRITDPARHMYQIARSMIVEPKKNLPGQGLRRMTIDQMCFLLTRDSGKPVSHSLMYQILSELKDLDLMVPLDTKQGLGSSQMKGKEKAARGILRGYLVRDLPPVPYTGWRNAWDKLNHYRPDWRENPPLPPVHEVTTVVDDSGRSLAQVTQRPQDAVFQDSGTEPEAPDQDDPDHDPFQNPGTDFQDSGTEVQDSGTDSRSTSGNAPAKQGSPTTLSKKSDGPIGRSPGGRRRPTTGSRSAGEGGSAASGKTSPPSRSADTSSKGSPAPAKLTAEERKVRAAVLELLPADFREALGPVIPTNVGRAVIDALGAGTPRERTPRELVEYRFLPRWRGYWAARFYSGELTPELSRGKRKRPFGPLAQMLADTAECGNLWCEDRHDFVTGTACTQCEMRKTDQRADRTREEAPPDTPAGAGLPSQRGAEPRREPLLKDCGNPTCTRSILATGGPLCGECQADVAAAEEAARAAAAAWDAEPPTPAPVVQPDDDAAETARLRAEMAARYGTPEQIDAYCNNAPF
jgi:hypothetical protein